MSDEFDQSKMWSFTDRYASEASKYEAQRLQREYVKQRLREYEGVRGAQFAVAEDPHVLRLDECDANDDVF